MARVQRIKEETPQFIEKVVKINRVTKVVKGGKNFSFNAIVVVGDGKGRVGHGLGKALEVTDAIAKGIEEAKRNLINVNMTKDGSIPHEITAKFGAGKVMLRPATAGTGVIAGGVVRSVVEAAGFKNILTKSLGSANAHNIVKATIKCLSLLKSEKDVLQQRGISKEQLYN